MEASLAECCLSRRKNFSNMDYMCPSGHPVEQMDPALSVLTPPRIATEAFTDAAAAVVRLDEIYKRNTHFLRDCFEAYVNGESSEPIPVHFAYRRDINVEAVLSSGRKSPIDRPLRDVFDTPDLAAMDDAIANGTLQRLPGAPEPLALFRAARVDYSLHRLYHYIGTDPEHFQNFVIFTNYQFYVDIFALGPRIGLGPLRLRRLRRARQCDHAQYSPRRRNVWRCP
jgi:Bacterial AMP nucleoside phosphorylase N-terminus